MEKIKNQLKENLFVICLFNLRKIRIESSACLQYRFEIFFPVIHEDIWIKSKVILLSNLPNILES